jgi:hypothetical protein
MKKYFKFENFEEAFIEISNLIVDKPEYITDSRIGDVHEISGLSYEVEDLQSYVFENESIGKLNYDYADKFYQWMIGGCTDNEIILKDYPNVAKFMEKPKSEGLPENFNTFYGPRILTQLPYVVRELKESPNSRRAVISILDKDDLLLLDKDESLEFPCCDSATFFIRDNKLHIHLHMRSQNMGQVLKLDMYLWGRFTCELAEELGYSPGKLTSSIVSAHVFKRDFEYIKTLKNE